MPVFILESTSLHAVPSACRDDTECGAFLASASAMVQGRTLCFCSRSVHELKALSGASPCHAWAAAEVRTMWQGSPDWYPIQDVISRVGELTDFDLLDSDVEFPEVIAMANALIEDGFDVVIVTEDSVTKPDIPSMTDACKLFEIPTADLASFGQTTGLNVHF